MSGLLLKLLGRFNEHSIIRFAPSDHMQAVVDAIEEDDLAVIYRPLILHLLGGTIARSFHDGVVGTGYLALED